MPEHEKVEVDWGTSGKEDYEPSVFDTGEKLHENTQFLRLILTSQEKVLQILWQFCYLVDLVFQSVGFVLKSDQLNTVF